MSQSFVKYGETWKKDNPVLIEMAAIRFGGRWQSHSGENCGKGLLFHYSELQRLLWPEDDEHRWAKLALEVMVENRITSFLGPASAGKTHPVSKMALMNYWIWPQDSLTLISTTDVRGLELRIWGRIKDLFNRAKKRWDRILPGRVIDSLLTITTDKVDKMDQSMARVLTRGIICVPCLKGQREDGISKFVGAKQSRLTLVGDEAQFLGTSFMDACANLNANPFFQARFMGNPKDPVDTLGRVSEPECGWSSHPEPKKTTRWKTKFLGGICVNFVGTDSPNFDFPADRPDRYPYMTGRRFIKEIGDFWGYDSQKYYEQCLGVMRSGALKWRIIDRDVAVRCGVKQIPVWKGDARQKIFALDAAYNGLGGDRCVGGWGEFGKGETGLDLLATGDVEIIKISAGSGVSAEDQIAHRVAEICRHQGIDYSNIFYDSTGRGTLGSAFARIMGTVTPVPVEFGGRPTKRPVRHDLFIQDEMTHQTRHKRCDEEYMNFVSELWFTARYLIECEQVRNLPEDVLMEGCLREYRIMAGNKIQIESKSDPKALERMGRSPDLFDWFVTLIEGARQRGLRIERLGGIMVEEQSAVPTWLEDARRSAQGILKAKRLSHS